MKPFLFERDFDIDPAELKRRREAERTAKRQAEQEAAEAVAEPPPPSYGQEELDQVAADSFQRGVEQGRAEAMTGIEQRLADSWQTVGDRFRQLQGAHQAALETLSTEVTELAYTMVRQISPTVAKTGGMQEIEAMIAEVFGSLRDEPRIMVRVHPDLVEQVRARMAEIAECHRQPPDRGRSAGYRPKAAPNGCSRISGGAWPARWNACWDTRRANARRLRWRRK